MAQRIIALWSAIAQLLSYLLLNILSLSMMEELDTSVQRYFVRPKLTSNVNSHKTETFSIASVNIKLWTDSRGDEHSLWHLMK